MLLFAAGELLGELATLVQEVAFVDALAALGDLAKLSADRAAGACFGLP